MPWFVYVLGAILGFTGWSLLAKVALATVPWVQLTLLYGAGIVGAGALATLLGRNSGPWGGTGTVLGLGSAACGAVAVISLYLALERGRTSVVVPLSALYPILTAALAVLLLGERLTLLQVVGVLLATVGAMLLGAGA